MLAAFALGAGRTRHRRWRRPICAPGPGPRTAWRRIRQGVEHSRRRPL